MSDLISRQAAIDALEKVAELYPWRVQGDRDSYSKYNEAWQDALNRADSEIKALPSAQPEIKPISYQDCANAMMMMWMDDVLTDGEYRRIMDKLNDHESRRENR